MQHLNFGIARFTRRSQLLQLLLPVVVLPFRKVAKAAPAVETRVMAIVEGDLHGVVSDRFNTGNGNRRLAGLQDLLSRAEHSDFNRG